MEDLKSALNEHVDLVSELLQRFSGELRTGFGPAYQNFLGFFHAIDWTEPWLICLITFHVTLLTTTIISRKNAPFQFCLSILAFVGVILSERINILLMEHWKSFASQNYFDSSGLFVSVLWAGPLLITAIVIVVNTLITLCQLMIKWKRAELRHRARLSGRKQD